MMNNEVTSAFDIQNSLFDIITPAYAQDDKRGEYLISENVSRPASG